MDQTQPQTIQAEAQAKLDKEKRERFVTVMAKVIHGINSYNKIIEELNAFIPKLEALDEVTLNQVSAMYIP